MDAQSAAGATSGSAPASSTYDPTATTNGPSTSSDVGASFPSDPESPGTINPLRLHVVERPGRGRGVFASRHIPAGTLLEDAPVLVLTKEQWEEGRMDDTILGEYGFCWSGGGMALGLGIGESRLAGGSPGKRQMERRTRRGGVWRGGYMRMRVAGRSATCVGSLEDEKGG